MVMVPSSAMFADAMLKREGFNPRRAAPVAG
jgi:hypothetical protein